MRTIQRCISDETLAALLDGTLEKGVTELCAAHLLTCARCYALLLDVGLELPGNSASTEVAGSRR